MTKGYIQLYRNLDPDQREIEEKLRVLANLFNLELTVEIHSPLLNKDGFDDWNTPYIAFRHFETATDQSEVTNFLAKFESLYTKENGMKGWIAYYHNIDQGPDPLKDELEKLAKQMDWTFESARVYTAGVPYINTFRGVITGAKAIRAFTNSYPTA